MEYYCSACSRTLCEECVTRLIGVEQCKVQFMALLHSYWVELKRRLSSNNSNVIACLDLIDPGTPCNKVLKIPEASMKEFLGELFGLYEQFQYANTYLRATYLKSGRRKVVAQPAGVVNEKQVEATMILRNWMCAMSPAQRSTWYNKARSLFLANRVSRIKKLL